MEVAPEVLQTPHGVLRTPAFIPDATRGAVRSVDAADLENLGVEALMMSAFHLMQRPGARRVKALGGLHRFTGWNGPIVTDSGGFQIYSLIRNDARRGVIRPNGAIFRDEAGKRTRLTPERSVRVQLSLGTDVLIALDDCTGLTEAQADLVRSVERTIRWFESARAELERQRGDTRLPLVGVVQGGHDLALRRSCARALSGLGANAFGFGGWPIRDDGTLQYEQFVAVHEALPEGAVLFALGVGKPEHIVAVARLGRPVVFDCTLPTRDARHHRLYVRRPGVPLEDTPSFYEFLYILDARHAGDSGAVSDHCDAICCTRYSRSYLHHLFKVKDALGERLATIHNLRFFVQLVAELRVEGDAGGRA